MNFNSLNQAITSIRMLEKFYTIVRIWDADRKHVLYEGKDAEALADTSVFISIFREVTFSVHEKEGILEINIPLAINGQTFNLELIQYNEDSGGMISSQHIQRLILTDALTNLYNRRYIDEQLPLDLNRSYQNNAPVSLIYADIDYFKKINDQYGHVAGDQLLKEVARIFQRLVKRKNGWVSRYGGDEFLVCLPGISGKTATEIANRIRHTVQENSFCINDSILKITCSFGVRTVYRTSGVHTVNQVVEVMDQKLYQAKKSGRNRVII